MPSIETTSLVKRETQEGTEMSTTYIVGIAIVGVIIVGVVLWLVTRQIRQRKRGKKVVERPEPISIPIVQTPRSTNSRRSTPISPLVSHDPFAAESILCPPPALVAPRSRDEIINFHRQSGTFPKPFSFALRGGSPMSGGSSPRSSVRLSSALVPPPSLASPNSENRPVSWVRHSFLSARSSMLPPGKRASSRYSVMSTASSLFFGSEPSTGTARKVRQLFSPVLPDELLLTALGEQLTVIQTFDDGWCVVGRENAHAELAQQKKSLFGKSGSVSSAAEAGAGAGVELGVVPAWCFLKPVKGLKAERPVRSTSLGITVQMEDGGPTRDNLISWSNF